MGLWALLYAAEVFFERVIFFQDATGFSGGNGAKKTGIGDFYPAADEVESENRKGASPIVAKKAGLQSDLRAKRGHAMADQSSGT